MKSKVIFKKNSDLTIANLQKELDNIYAMLSRLEKKINDIDNSDDYGGEVIPVDETDTNSVKNKAVSNLLAYGWETNKHGRLHALNSVNDHSSDIAEDDIMTADANGLPKDSGKKISDLSTVWGPAPAEPTDNGTEHEMALDDDHLYIYNIDIQLWKRVSLSTWSAPTTGTTGQLIGIGLFTYSS